MLRSRWSAALAAAIFMAAAGNASAATIVVNTTSGTSPASDGLCSLGEAIADVDAPGASSGDCAPAAFGANTITLGPHTYQLGSPAAGQVSALNIASTVTGLHITGAGESSTIIDASGSGTRALEIAAGASVTISDLTVTGGHAPDGAAGSPATDSGMGGPGGPGASGGGILNDGSLAVSDAAVTNSVAGDGGSGGVGGTGGSSGDSTDGVGGFGGGGGSGGGIYNDGNLTLQAATMSGDQAGAGGLGGTAGTTSGTTSGDAPFGGPGGYGGAGGGVGGGGIVVVTASTINGNHAGNGGSGGSGSGAQGAGGGGGNGGGIDLGGGELTISNSTLASNDAGDAGFGGAGAPPVGPSPGVRGPGGDGGALVANSPMPVALQDDTIAGNESGSGGYESGTTGGVGGDAAPMTIEDTLLYRDGSDNCEADVTDGGHNLSFGAGGCPGSFISGNPNLGPLQDNGGPTKTISLQPGSAAIDAGAGCPATDQRGVPRPATTACDIGAYEVAAPKAQTESPSSVSAHGATLVAQVTPNSGDAGVSFLFGRSRKYGSQTKPQQLDGVTATPISAKLGRLKDHTTYHYRVRVTSMDGTTVGADRTFTTSDKPALRSLRLKPARFNVAGTATMISYTDNLAARTRFTVLRATPGVRQGKRCVARTGHSGHGGNCTRYIRVGGFSHTDVIGTNKVSFSGRLGSHKLGPGRYELTAVPRAGKHGGTVRMVKFTVIG